MKILLISAFILFAILFALTRFEPHTEPVTPPPPPPSSEIVPLPPSFDPNALPELQ